MSRYVGLKIGKEHEEHTVSEYYCGGCGWPVTDHDSYCPECGGAFQKSFADDALEVENAKLRELVRVFYHCTTSGECDECPINGGSTVHLMPDTICGTIHERMRELDVEVE